MIRKVVICTAPRKTDYIHKTLYYTWKEAPTHLFVASNHNTEYLDRYKNQPDITITKFPYNGPDSIVYNQMETYNTSLRDGYVDGDDGVLIVEDDVRFAVGWKKRLEEIIADLKSKYGDNFFLTLFTNLTFCSQTNTPLSGYFRVTKDNGGSIMFGSQGMYFTKKLRNDILKYFEIFSSTDIRRHQDIKIRDCVLENDIPFFVTIPCIVNHIGNDSTWSAKSIYTNTATVFHNVLN